MPAQAWSVVHGVSHDEGEVLDFGVPEAVVVHCPFHGFEALDGVGSGEVLEEEAGGGEEGVSGSFWGCGDGGEELKSLEGN